MRARNRIDGSAWIAGISASLFTMVLIGCGEPMVVPVVMPGSNPIHEIAEEDQAVALGEQMTKGAVQPPTSQGDQTIAISEHTEVGETKTLASGIEYTTLKIGDGPVVRPGDKVRVHYVGTLLNGAKFESSRDRGQPSSFMLGTGAVIRGWDEGISGMQVGEVRKLTIPPNKAYGDAGLPPAIPPKSTVVFEFELLGIE